MLTLRDLGERKIASAILPKYTVGIGDDCASVTVAGQSLVMTTDPVPVPAANLLAGDRDLYWMGWLLVVINASDLAAAAANPLAFLSAIECPADTTVDEFERLLAGIADCCQSEGLSYVGGNLREAGKIAAVGTAVGTCVAPLHRLGVQAGDVICSVGAGGLFWRDAFTMASGGTIDRKSSPLFAPRSQLHTMPYLAERVAIHAAMDNSDGLLPTLTQMAEINSCRMVLSLERLRVPGPVPSDVEPARLWLGWGDWNVIITLAKQDVAAATAAASDRGSEFQVIGYAEKGVSQVLVERDGSRKIAPRLESERFAKDSWFSVGIEEYVRLLKTVAI